MTSSGACSAVTVEARRIVKSVATPASDIAGTTRPATAPPRSAVRNAPAVDVRAETATRTLVRMATHIPSTPAVPEQNAPNTNAAAVASARIAAGAGSWLEGVLTNAYRTYTSTAVPAAIIAIVRYWRRMNASAPSLIAPYTTCIPDVPASPASNCFASSPAATNVIAHALSTNARTRNSMAGSCPQKSAAVAAARMTVRITGKRNPPFFDASSVVT